MSKIEIQAKLKIAKEARALITDFKNWTRRAMARTSEKVSCTYNADNAVCWCAVGALKRVANKNLRYGSDILISLNKKTGEIINQTFPKDIVYLNDLYWSDVMMDFEENHRLVLQAYDMVIADLENELANI